MKELKMDYYVIHSSQGYYNENGFLNKWTPHLEKAKRFLNILDINWVSFNVHSDWIKRIQMTEESI